MEFIDSHCHLYAQQYIEDRDEVIKNAQTLGIQKVVLPNIDLQTLEDMWPLVDKDPSKFFPTIGLHPCSVDQDYKKTLNQLRKKLESQKYVAIGEIGIDLYWDKAFFNEQKDAFLIQCQWAKALNMPIIIHSRDSFDEIFELIDSIHDKNLFGVFHCFTGNKAQAQKILNYGNFYLGIGGVITFKNSGLTKSLENVPVEKILLETDAPYLAPQPYRGKRNEPKFLMHIAEKLAEVYKMPLSEIAKITTKNSETLFGI